ncbi:MAG: DUF177 domain-containing protein [Coriobacteriia bacterium]|nr:DUF177 domain-containing protein [Coriobacteriia bacterium]
MQELILHIPNEMFVPGAIKKVNGTFHTSKISNNTDTYKLMCDVEYNLDLTNTGDAFLLKGAVNTKAKTSCSRCLEDIEVELTGKVDAFYIIDGEPDYENELLPSSHDINLGELICASLIVDAPLKPLCKEDCKGLCPQCGKNLNEEMCDCKSESTSPFAVLKDFKVEG